METVSFEVVVKPEKQRKSVYSEDAFPSSSNLEDYKPPMDKNVVTARKLQQNGIIVLDVGEFSISASCAAKKFEDFFSTRIRETKIDASGAGESKVFKFNAPQAEDNFAIPSDDGLDNLIERAYIQHDPIFFSERAVPPFWNDKFRLRVPVDVAQLMGASSVHKKNITGKGVKVVMPDTGFYHHPYFEEQGYNFLSVAAPDTVDYSTDPNGHGTGECANLFATAPGINFVGVKMGNPTLAFKTAVQLKPDVITCSWGYDMDRPNTGMPNWLKPLYLAVLDAVSKGITVCFSAGNGHYGFPGSIPEVVSVGGVIVDGNLQYSATSYTSGFDSTWFPGRSTPDISGLCGERPTADYIVLPVMDGAVLQKNDGWGAFSGTSAASPMVAGICALLKEANPKLTPEEIKNILKFTARDITVGINAHGRNAHPGPDGATGFGLVQGDRAINAVL
ncbi:MAG: S8 family serine peptidase [Bacteroidota bacterium]